MLQTIVNSLITKDKNITNTQILEYCDWLKYSASEDLIQGCRESIAYELKHRSAAEVKWHKRAKCKVTGRPHDYAKKILVDTDYVWLCNDCNRVRRVYYTNLGVLIKDRMLSMNKSSKVRATINAVKDN